MSPLTIDFGQGNQLENKGKVREIRILKLVAILPKYSKSMLGMILLFQILRNRFPSRPLLSLGPNVGLMGRKLIS